MHARERTQFISRAESGCHDTRVNSRIGVIVRLDFFHSADTWVFSNRVGSGPVCVMYVPVHNLSNYLFSESKGEKMCELTRPTNGEMTVTFASAHALACTLPNTKVIFVATPSRSSVLAACIPSYVAGILMSTRRRSTRATGARRRRRRVAVSMEVAE